MIEKNKKIAFFGTPEFTVPFLELFESAGYNISLVVTGEDKAVGRGMQMQMTGPKKWAKKMSLPFLSPQKLDTDFKLKLIDAGGEDGWDLFIVIAYGKILPENIINLPKRGTINLHYSLLPKYRGASPVESAILAEETETGITIQQMKYGLDSGDILYQEKIKINKTETTSELRVRMNMKSQEIFPEFLNSFLEEKTVQKPQDETLATKCGKFTKQDLDVTEDIENNDLGKIYLKYKAFDRKVYFFHTMEKLNKNVRVKITSMDEENILKILPESKKEITLKDFENSYGEIFKKNALE